MSEIQTAEIQAMPKSERKGIGFQTFGLLELHLICLKFEPATPTIIQHLNAICKVPFLPPLGMGGQELK